MRRLFILIFILPLFTTIVAQQVVEIKHSTLQLDHSCLFIDNTVDRHFTMEFPADTIILIKQPLYSIGNEPVQIFSDYYDKEKENGVEGSAGAEKFALEAHMRSEMDDYKEVFGKRLKPEKEYYNNKHRKPFLLWYYKTPKKSNLSMLHYEVNLGKKVDNTDSIAIVDMGVSHQLYLEFIVHGKTHVSICKAVPTKKLLGKNIRYLKDLANTLEVYGGDIDLLMLSQKISSEEKVVFSDSLDLLKIEIPEWLNMLSSSAKNTILGSFPEKDNIYDLVSIGWEYAAPERSFEDFIAACRENHTLRDDIQELTNEENKQSAYYTLDGGLHQCQEVYLKGEKVYCQIVLTATENTYGSDLGEFYALLENIDLK